MRGLKCKRLNAVGAGLHKVSQGKGLPLAEEPISLSRAGKPERAEESEGRGFYFPLFLLSNRKRGSGGTAVG